MMSRPAWTRITEDNFLRFFSLQPRADSYNHWIIVVDKKTHQALKEPGSNRRYLKYSCSDTAVKDVIKMIKEGQITLQ